MPSATATTASSTLTARSTRQTLNKTSPYLMASKTSRTSGVSDSSSQNRTFNVVVWQACSLTGGIERAKEDAGFHIARGEPGWAEPLSEERVRGHERSSDCRWRAFEHGDVVGSALVGRVGISYVSVDQSYSRTQCPIQRRMRERLVNRGRTSVRAWLRSTDIISDRPRLSVVPEATVACFSIQSRSCGVTSNHCSSACLVPPAWKLYPKKARGFATLHRRRCRSRMLQF